MLQAQQMRRIAGGGEGMGAIEATLDAIATACGGACQVVAICGRNRKLARRLQNRRALASYASLILVA